MKALITGASPGIGGATARKLAEVCKRDGVKLQIALHELRDTPERDALASELEGLGADVITPNGDLTDPETPARLVAATVDAFGGLTSVLSNAGAAAPGPMAELSLDDWDLLMNINTRAMWLMGKAAYPHLKDSKGAYVAVASMSGMNPHPWMGAYSISKAACIMMVRLMAQEWAQDGIRANAVSPGMIRTPFSENVYRDNAMAQRRSDIVPLGRVGAPDDIGDVCAWLLSNEARYVTGQNLCADGGFSNSINSYVPGLPKPKVS